MQEIYLENTLGWNTSFSKGLHKFNNSIKIYKLEGME